MDPRHSPRISTDSRASSPTGTQRSRGSRNNCKADVIVIAGRGRSVVGPVLGSCDGHSANPGTRRGTASGLTPPTTRNRRVGTAPGRSRLHAARPSGSVRRRRSDGARRPARPRGGGDPVGPAHSRWSRVLRNVNRGSPRCPCESPTLGCSGWLTSRYRSPRPKETPSTCTIARRLVRRGRE